MGKFGNKSQRLQNVNAAYAELRNLVQEWDAEDMPLPDVVVVLSIALGRLCGNFVHREEMLQRAIERAQRHLGDIDRGEHDPVIGAL